MRAWVLAVVCVGCYSPPSYQHCALTCETAANACPSGLMCGGDGRCYSPGIGPCDGTDAAPMPDDKGPPPVCLGVDAAPYVQICPSNLVESSTMALSGSIPTTDPCPNDDPNHLNLCVVAATNLDIMGSLDVRGTRPLVLVATDTLTVRVDVVVDAAGHNNDPPTEIPRPNANLCTAASAMSAAGTEGVGGGAGGVLGGDAGDGGSAFTVGGQAAMFTAPTTLRGGCRGGDGAMSGIGIGGAGGNAGGAIYLLANKLHIDGEINASGGGGRRASMLGGGAGGGAGGMILLWARSEPEISTTALILALGGGGSSGAGNGVAGIIGNDPMNVFGAPDTTSPGGGIGVGGAGGGYQNLPGQDGGAGSTMTGGGGGGGGSVGVIKSIPPITLSGLKIAPDPTN